MPDLEKACIQSVRLQRPHVLILVENLPVPLDRRVWLEALSLTEAGYKVSVISPCPEDEFHAPHRCLQGVHLYRYALPPAAGGKLAFVREFGHALRETWRLVRQIWRQDRFDVLQACNPPDMFWAIAKAYRSRGVKFVFDQHDLCPELYESKFGRRDLFHRVLCWMERQQYGTADAVIATNESYKEIALGRGRKKPETVTVVRSGPLLEKFRPVPPDPSLKRGRQHLVVYVGVMGSQDGVDCALRAIRHFVDQGGTDTLFAFLGSGECLPSLQALALELGIEEHVVFTGWAFDDRLRSYLSTATLGLAPDPKTPLNDVSTMNKVVDYMAMGLPIVSFDLKESRRSAGDAAVYVSGDDERALASAIRDLLGDPARRQQMGAVGRLRAEESLSWEHGRRALLDVYQRLLPLPASPRSRPLPFQSGGAL